MRTILKKDIYEWFLLVALFYSHGSHLFNISVSVFMPSLLLLYVGFLYVKYNIALPKFFGVAFGILLLNHFITGLLSGASLSEGLNITTWLQMLFICTAVFWLYKVDGNAAMEKFIKLTVLFAIISLVCYGITIAGYGSIFTKIFPTHWGSGGTRIFYGSWFYAYNPFYDRNNGVFLEPGVYQIVLVASLYILILFRESLSFSKKQVALFVVIISATLISTKSTTGYLGGVAILVGYFFKKKENKDILFGSAIAAATMYIIYDYYTKGDSSLLYSIVVNKFEEISERGIELSSGGARIVTMQLAIEAAKNHLFGIGYLEFEHQIQLIYGGKFGTGNALFSQLGIRGIIAFTTSIYLAVKPAVLNQKGLVEFIVFLFLFVNIATAQAMILYPAVMMIAFYNPSDSFVYYKGMKFTV